MRKQRFRIECIPITCTSAMLVGSDIAGAAPESQWVGAWAGPASHNLHPPSFEQSFRVIVRPSSAGSAVRVQLSNLFGTSPVQLRSMSVAKRITGPRIDSAASPLTVNGDTAVTLALGDEVLSDSVPLAVTADEDMAVSYYVSGQVPTVTSRGSAGLTTTS